MCTGSIPLELKPMLSLYMNNFFTTPVTRDGKRIEFEDIVLDLERETVAYYIANEGSNNELIALHSETEPENYEKVISWIRTLLFDAVHDAERLHSSLTKLLASIPDEKRSGQSMMGQVHAMVSLKPESSVRASNTLSKALYLRRLRKMLQNDKDAVISKFADLCKTLSRPENFRIYVAADLEKLPNPVSAWKTLIPESGKGKPLEPLDDRRALLSEVGSKPGSAAYIVPMGTIDSSFAMLSGSGPDSYDHPDLPALMVATACMDAVEGPLWVAVRGTGLAYGSGFSRSVDTGQVHFRISRAPDAYRAYAAAKEQVEGYASGKLVFDKFALEGAISEIVLDMANRQPTMASAAASSFANQVIKGISKDWSRELLPKVQAVTSEQLQEVMRKYMVPIFQPESSNLVVTCAQIMKDGLESGFEAYKPQVRTLESFQDAYGLDGDDEGGDEEDEEDEDDAVETPDSDEEDDEED